MKIATYRYMAVHMVHVAIDLIGEDDNLVLPTYGSYRFELTR